MSLQPRILLVLVDGMRPDAMQLADTPTIDRLMASGAYTLQGRTVMPSVTLPCCTSLFHGSDPGRHGITTNTWTPQVRPVPGLFEVVCDGGFRCMSFYNWEQLRDLSRPGWLRASYFMSNCHVAGGLGDTELTSLAAEKLGGDGAADAPWDLAFLYLGHTDVAGHDHGWMTEPYIDAIANADRCIGSLLAALDDNVTIILVADHGGHMQTHGTDADVDMTIPVVLSGAGIPALGELQQSVSITDIAPTIAAMFGLACPSEWSGSAIALDS